MQHVVKNLPDACCWSHDLSVVHITIYPAIDVEEEVCTVELEEPIAVTGSSAAFSIRGVGSDIVGFTCKLDRVQLANCMLIQCCTIFCDYM